MSTSEAEKVKLDTGNRKSISYSQFSTWLKCPYAWKLGYIDKMTKYESTIHTCFGTAIHEAIQTFLLKLFGEGSIAADEVDTIQIFQDVFVKELKGERKVSCKDSEGDYILDVDGNKTYDTVSEPVKYDQEQFDEFVEHGKLILNTITDFANRQKYFPVNKYELVGIEIPINMDVMHNLCFIGYLDIVLKEKKSGKIRIIDLKTASRMWNKYQQNDMGKIYQLLFYKAFYSKQFGIPISKIDVEFLILKRTLLEGVSFPESRIQKVVPPSGKIMVDEAVTELVNFIKSGFTPEGDHNKYGVFRKNPHKGKTRYSNCKYCEFSCKNGGPCDRKEGTCD